MRTSFEPERLWYERKALGGQQERFWTSGFQFRKDAESTSRNLKTPIDVLPTPWRWNKMFFQALDFFIFFLKKAHLNYIIYNGKAHIQR